MSGAKKLFTGLFVGKFFALFQLSRKTSLSVLRGEVLLQIRGDFSRENTSEICAQISDDETGEVARLSARQPDAHPIALLRERRVAERRRTKMRLEIADC